MRLLVLIAALSIGFAQETDADKTDSPKIPVLHQSVVITASPVEPAIDRRNAEALIRLEPGVQHIVNRITVQQ